MNAPALRAPLPVLSHMLRQQLSTSELGHLLEEGDESSIALARRALASPLEDILARPGKVIRGRLLAEAYSIAKRPGAFELPADLPEVVEMLHVGSLIVDDIEDDAKERRGAPALHATYGLPIALNAGNWLYFWAFDTLARLPLPPSISLSALREVSSTMLRCHHGQAMDLALRVTDLPAREIPRAVELSTRLKTGSLLELSARLGALVGGAGLAEVDALGTFGREVGVALQMLDDLGSVLSPARRKKGLEDLGAARLTWVWAFLAEGLDEISFRALQRDLAAALGAGRAEQQLEVVRRALDPEVRKVPRARLARAIAGLREAFGRTAAVEALIRNVQHLEQSYG